MPTSRPILVASLLAAVLPTLLGRTQDAPAPDSPPSLPWPIAVPRSAMAEHGSAGYLAAALDLLDRDAEGRADPLLRVTYLDVLGTCWARLGEERRAIELGDEAFPQPQPEFADADERESFLAALHPAPAIDGIVSASAGRRVVMINEEHRSSRQRAFANELLEPLRAAGFTHLALETLSEDASTLAARGYPLLSSGTYTQDPLLGDLVRHALELGYVVVGYEADLADRLPRPDDASPLDAVNRREAGQARNLFARTLAVDPEARVLVYAGRDHIAEGEADGWTPMGGLFAKLAETDPLTINLLGMTERSRPELEHRAYRAVDGAGWLDDGPILLTEEDGDLWSASPDALDAYAFLPRTRLESGRPHWMRLGGRRMEVAFAPAESEEPLLLQALVAGEDPQAVPADQAVAWPARPAPALLLRPGRYVLRAIDRAGDVLHEEECTVDAK